MAAFLGLTDAELIRRHCEPHSKSGIPGWWLLQSIEAPGRQVRAGGVGVDALVLRRCCLGLPLGFAAEE